MSRIIRGWIKLKQMYINNLINEPYFTFFGIQFYLPINNIFLCLALKTVLQNIQHYKIYTTLYLIKLLEGLKLFLIKLFLFHNISE